MEIEVKKAEMSNNIREGREIFEEMSSSKLETQKEEGKMEEIDLTDSNTEPGSKQGEKRNMYLKDKDQEENKEDDMKMTNSSVKANKVKEQDSATLENGQDSRKKNASLVWWYGMIQGRRYNIKRTADGCSHMSFDPYSMVIPSLPVYFGRMGKVEKEMCNANKRMKVLDENEPSHEAEGGFYLHNIGYYIPLSDSVNISRWHAKLHCTRDKKLGSTETKNFRLTCLSKNGMVVDNRFLMPGEWCNVKNESLVKIGSTEINLHLVIGEGEEEPADSSDIIANKIYFDRQTGAKKRAVYEAFIKEELLKSTMLPRLTSSTSPLNIDPPIQLPNLNQNAKRVTAGDNTVRDIFLQKVAAVLKVPVEKLSGKSNAELENLIEHYGNSDESLPHDALDISDTTAVNQSSSNLEQLTTSNSYPMAVFDKNFAIDVKKMPRDTTIEGRNAIKPAYIPPFPLTLNMTMNPQLNLKNGTNFSTSISPLGNVPSTKKRKRSTNVTDEVFKEVKVNKKGLPFYEFQSPTVPLTYWEYVRVACLSPELYEHTFNRGLTSFEITKWTIERYDEWKEPIERRRQFMNGVQNILTRKFERIEESSPRTYTGTPGQKGSRWRTLESTKEQFERERAEQIQNVEGKNIECYPYNPPESELPTPEPTP